MSRCPKLKVDDTGWFSYTYICSETGAKVGDENNNTKVKYLCDCDEHYNCPIYNR